MRLVADFFPVKAKLHDVLATDLIDRFGANMPNACGVIQCSHVR